MKKILVSLLVAATTLNFVACSSSSNGGETTGDSTKKETSGKAVTISVQVEKDWLPYYEKVKETVEKNNPNATIEFIEMASFDHLDTIDKTDPTNKDVADVFALPADRLYGLAQNNVLAAMDAKAMAERVGGFKDFDNGLGGNFKVDGDYLAFPYNIETLIGFVNKENAAADGIDVTKPIEFTKVGYNEMLVTAVNAWWGVAFANSADFELLGKKSDGTLFSDGTKAWSELDDTQKGMFEALYNYWKANNENTTDLWDKDASAAYIDANFKTGEKGAVRIDGPWSTNSIAELVGSADNLEIIPLTNITVNGKEMTHWKGGWGLGINARVEEDADKMAVAEAFIEEVVNPANAKELFDATGKILENVEPSAYDGVDDLQKKVIEATYASYEKAPARPLFTEWGNVWDTWQNGLLAWSSTKPASAEEAYNQVKASFDAMMTNIKQ